MSAPFRSGFAALVGRPNVGKSTLINRLVGQKLAIVSPKPQTTRHRVLGVVNRDHAQIAFVDTPGVHQAKSPLNRWMVEVAQQAAAECDVVVFMVDADGQAKSKPTEVSDTHRFALERIATLKKPTVLVLTKIDRVSKLALLPLIEAYRHTYPFAEVVPLSAKSGDGLEVLVEVVSRLLPEGDRLYPDEVFTNQDERTLVAEYVREQVLKRCHDEVPHSTAVVVDHFDESERGQDGRVEPKSTSKRLTGLVRIYASVFVERESQKAIVIGKRGQMLKTIGTDARQNIERLLGAHVYLSLQVKVAPKWSERPERFADYGLSHES